MGSGDELVDVVDEHDTVVGVTTRREMRAGRLRHRSVFILVRNTAGDVLVQQGTNHAWVNRGTQPCRIAFVLIDAQEP